jgi:hypothetical protein
MRFKTEDKMMEFCNGSAWLVMAYTQASRDNPDDNLTEWTELNHSYSIYAYSRYRNNYDAYTKNRFNATKSFSLPYQVNELTYECRFTTEIGNAYVGSNYWKPQLDVWTKHTEYNVISWKMVLVVGQSANLFCKNFKYR